MKRYVVVKEPDVDWCRLRLADSPDVEGLEVLWQGNGLRAGYDAMIRINSGRRPIVQYYIAQRSRTIRLFKSPPSEDYNVLGVFGCHVQARSFLSKAVKTREMRERAERESLIQELRSLGVQVKSRLPRLTVTDRRYLAWRKERKLSTDMDVMRNS